ncbi:hypothetical protein D8O27_25240 [Burkholderia mallei]|uniref:Uncharacterized protein n=2 Tax=Burkholderia mallei TaxID=13373 RepID=A2S4T8_BURM9|nr:hypothetical protein BMA10229_A0968 [Burkholderia mallei NCTC 10229]ABN82992.1 hypothetical protein BURPS668_2904 [Burkholderia pseudomallei 668]ABO05355.1 hypothetical protein BMA10247_0179 [Burkholderia mallei NCTC 10247]EDK57871.1 hypothetical protein BMAJHU_D0349 [Burkholderia mallei JHU]EEP87590.1 conserved hypothetical protein [Burkholderia mallei GB8 horse 4]EES46389.1 conserved hypothetical protein [Burkholderia mallei PRL-20]KAA8768661.1 hypothetical protein F5D26_11400 [Burkholde
MRDVVFGDAAGDLKAAALAGRGRLRVGRRHRGLRAASPRRMHRQAMPRCVVGAGMRGAGGANGMRVDRCNATSIRM